MTPYIEELKSFIADPDVDDETGHYIGTGMYCENCSESFDPGDLVISAPDYHFCRTCAASIGEKLIKLSRGD